MTRIFKGRGGGGAGGSEYVLAVRVQTSRGGVGEILAREKIGKTRMLCTSFCAFSR